MAKIFWWMILSVIFAIPAEGWATEPTEETVLTEEYDESEESDDSDDKLKNTHNRHKMPPRPVMCTIDFTTCKVTLSNGVSSGEIVEYEIADCEGCPFMQFTEESSFVFSLSTLPSGDYMIRFRLPDRTFSGYISR